jgi:hypothetical protein
LGLFNFPPVSSVSNFKLRSFTASDVVAVHSLGPDDLIYKVRVPAVEGAYIHVYVRKFLNGSGWKTAGPEEWYELDNIAIDIVKGEDGEYLYKVLLDDDYELGFDRGVGHDDE